MYGWHHSQHYDRGNRTLVRRTSELRFGHKSGTENKFYEIINMKILVTAHYCKLTYCISYAGFEIPIKEY